MQYEVWCRKTTRNGTYYATTKREPNATNAGEDAKAATIDDTIVLKEDVVSRIRCHMDTRRKKVCNEKLWI